MRPGDACFDHYDQSFPRFRVLPPTFWLALVWALTLVMLHASDYLDRNLALKSSKAWAALLAQTDDGAASSAARAFNGVTIAISMSLAITSAIWAWLAFSLKAPAYRWRVVVVVLGFFLLSLAFAWLIDGNAAPFASELGAVMVNPSRLAALQTCPAAEPTQKDPVPVVMFAVACTVPFLLLAGASFLLQPMRWSQETHVLREQLQILADRLRELDQMLYIGALALVFGTLQLSASLSVPLANMPRAAALKVEADLCKTMAPAPAASSPFYDPLNGASSRALLKRCRELPGELVHLEGADSLRELTRGITLSFGLAFTAMLAAIYVPALISLRLMIEPKQHLLAARPGAQTAAAALIGAVDPLHRIAAIAATLSPLLAGLVANAFGSA